MRLDNKLLGNSKPKNSWQDLTISILLVLKSFIKNRLVVKSSEAICAVKRLLLHATWNQNEVFLNLG